MSDINTSAAATAPSAAGHTSTELGSDPASSGAGGTTTSSAPRSLRSEAWGELRRNPVFIISALLIVFFTVMAVRPSVFTGKDPRLCELSFSRQTPSSSAWFGYDLQGCDVYAQTVYGARASIEVGLLATISTLILGSLVGVLAGYYSGWIDTLLSRMTDIFFAIPTLLGGIIILSTFTSDENTSETAAILKVTAALAVLGWTPTARIMRSSVIQVKQADFVLAARALGASSSRIILRHIVPNSLGPVIVVATISLGVYIGAEATLSFLGIGLRPPIVSWGIAIEGARDYVRDSPHMLLFPGAALSLTVLAFIMLGDAVRDAFDPKLR